MDTIEAIRARNEPVRWPPADGIDFPAFDEGAPCIAGTKFLVRNMQLYDGSGLSRPDLVLSIKGDWALLTKPGINAALDYWHQHRDLFERDHRWRHAGTEELRADIAALLCEIDRLRAENTRLQGELTVQLGEAR